MEQKELQERMLGAWIGINGMLKDSRMTQNLTYNEAIVMKLVYDQYKTDGVGRTAVQYIIRETRMVKSLVNRTVNSLCSQNYLLRERDGEDGRNLFVRPKVERLSDFLIIHQHSLQMVQSIIDVIGEEDARCFVRIFEKLNAADLQF